MPYSEGVLTSVGVSVHQHIGNFKESVTLSAKQLTNPSVSALGTIEERIKYATTEVIRDDIQTRDMNLCIKLLTESITGAKQLDSKLFIRKARQCYHLLRVAWPHEDAIRTLGREHFGFR